MGGKVGVAGLHENRRETSRVEGDPGRESEVMENEIDLIILCACRNIPQWIPLLGIIIMPQFKEGNFRGENDA